jgi:CDP-paratose 2-epimerase
MSGREDRPLERVGGTDRRALITGGAGFIGTNLAHRLASLGRPVTILDNLSRPGVERNLHWLLAAHGGRIRVEIADVRDSRRMADLVAGCDQVFHLAAQVAVTTSLEAPREDFATNLEGTMNVLEGLRRAGNGAGLIFTSTNKVYGALADLELVQEPTRYRPADPDRQAGVSERQPLDFHSPYGCSKGAADQYVLDYARSFDIPTLVARMSCIYGPHQCGTEDQGWVAHFIMQALAHRPITLYGDGRQVRDILFVEDLVDAFLLAERSIGALAGQAFNLGGGAANAVSLIEVLSHIARLVGHAPSVAFGPWRQGDQRYYVTDTAKFRHAAGWSPKIDALDGIARLYRWLADHAVAQPMPAVIGKAS